MGAEEENAIVFPCPHVAIAFLKNEMLSSLFSVLFCFILFFCFVLVFIRDEMGKELLKE